jgi:large subunit ribosomal protein L6
LASAAKSFVTFGNGGKGVSRIGRKPIPLPSAVEVKIDGLSVTASGAKGTVNVNLPSEVVVEQDGGVVTVSTGPGAIPGAWGLSRSLVANAVEGVSTGFRKRLLIVGVGYRGEVSGSNLTLQVGFSHTVEIPVPDGLTVSTEAQESVVFKGETHPAIPVVVEGADKQAVGDLAAKIRAVRKPEPYKGKGIRYADERVRTDKAGKTA